MSQTEKKPSRLAGEELEVWYARDRVERSSTFTYLARPTQSGKGSFIATSIWLGCWNVGGWVFPPWTAMPSGVLGLWLVIGSGNFWWRTLVTAAAILPTVYRQPFSAGYALIVLVSTLLFSYIALGLIPVFLRIPTRSVRFTLWDLGGGILGCSFLLAFLRVLVANDEISRQPFAVFLASLSAVYFGFCVVAACFPVLILPSQRHDKLLLYSGVLLFIVLPLLVSLPFLLFTNEPPMGIALGACLPHWMGACFLWLLVFPMDSAGFFSRSEPDEEKRSENRNDADWSPELEIE
ncbi:hypothetical protein [Blastopirellula marina]|uniref:Uncharacterized protein n=1 Tax=Blastopirellula marina TaxID=124 RepID=A0A2S8FXV4_9BACT|nr:hypothetical protein [Blastopirellula marina]PQO36674.1 hypothetical protein C5Y98_11825 [Blastopirellula marina]PTL44504.1 hypothetical protein C5Y97_11835 [Blastopirellula marina]